MSALRESRENPVDMANSTAQTISTVASSIDALQPVYELVASDFKAVNALIPQQLTSDVDLVEEIGTYIVESGGKRGVRTVQITPTASIDAYSWRK